MKERGFYLYENKYYYCSDTNTLISAEIRDVYLKSRENRKVDIKDDAVDADSLRTALTGLKQVIFEVTQQCPLQCRYCAYESGEYLYNRIGGSRKTLELETAKAVIDHVWQLIKERDKKVLTIGFYGGEPLLEYETMKKIVAYSKSVFDGWDLTFTITTNAVLLNDTIIRYLIEENFSTFISLDGPEENHDAKRVFPEGAGSYGIVVKKLKRIKDSDPDYYNNRVTFSAVYSKDLPFEETFRFFNEHSLVKDIPLIFGYVNEADTTYYTNNPYDPIEYRRSLNNMREPVKKKKVENKELSAIESRIFQNQNRLLQMLDRNQYTSLMGACFFDSRLFVDADGGFHICEKMNDKFRFGSAEDGFDYEKMARIANDYIALLKKNCTQCEVNYLCQRCYIHFAKDGRFEMNGDFCTKKKSLMKKALEELIEIEEGKLKHGVDTNE